MPTAPDPSPAPPSGRRAPVTVVIIHRNRPDAVSRTVAAFREQTVATDIIVVDNGSTPETVAALPGLVNGAELVLTGANLGFGPGGNVGLRRFLRHRTGEWVALAPHDALPEADTIEKMLAEVADRPTVGLMSADVGDGKRPVIDPFLGTIDAEPTVDEGFDVADYPHGTLMMCRRGCLDEIGLFDERYFAYCEESELAIRAARAGWICGVVRGAMVRNPGMSASIERVAYLQLRNTLLMLREHYGRWNRWFRIFVALIQIPVGMLYPPARGLHWSPRGRVKAIRDHLLGRYGPPPDDIGGA
jgi:N-acetylglucosaminyl-diphospho-decaprenol L-rhamnosyltransferase